MAPTSITFWSKTAGAGGIGSRHLEIETRSGVFIPPELPRNDSLPLFSPATPMAAYGVGHCLWSAMGLAEGKCGGGWQLDRLRKTYWGRPELRCAARPAQSENTLTGSSKRPPSSYVIREAFPRREASLVSRQKKRANGIWRMAYGRLHMSRTGT